MSHFCFLSLTFSLADSSCALPRNILFRIFKIKAVNRNIQISFSKYWIQNRNENPELFFFILIAFFFLIYRMFTDKQIVPVHTFLYNTVRYEAVNPTYFGNFMLFDVSPLLPMSQITTLIWKSTFALFRVSLFAFARILYSDWFRKYFCTVAVKLTQKNKYTSHFRFNSNVWSNAFYISCPAPVVIK